MRLHYDDTRESWVIVSPKRVSMLNQNASEILQLIDDKHTINMIAEELSSKFHTPKELILKDAVTTLQDLHTHGILTC